MDRDALSDRLISSPLARSLADALFRRRVRRRLRALDGTSAARAQVRTLLGLVHRARGTRFGAEHDFGRIRTPDDFRRLVPLGTAAELWRQYGAPAMPSPGGATWPGPLSFLATCASPSGQTLPPLPVSAELVASHREALWTALAFVTAARPRARLLSGSLLLVGGGAALTPLRPGAAAASLEELVCGQLPWVLRPSAVVAPSSGDVPLRALAQRSAALPVTCLVSNAGRLKKLLGCLRQLTGKERLVDVWPNLTAVLYSRGPADPDRDELARFAGARRGHPPVLLLEGCVQPEGVLAVEDPRHGRMRVVPDHGAYFEFVPLEELGRPRPRRHDLGDVVPAAGYALAVTSPAGLWACLTGLTVCFEYTDPPLLRSVEVGLPSLAPASRARSASDGTAPSLALRARGAPAEVLPLRSDGPHPGLPLPAPRPQSAGSAAGPARKFSRTPWSARADQI